MKLSYSFPLATQSAPTLPPLQVRRAYAYAEFHLDLPGNWRQVPTQEDNTLNFQSDADRAAITVSADLHDIPADKAQGLAEQCIGDRIAALEAASPGRVTVIQRAIKPHTSGAGFEMSYAAEVEGEQAHLFLGYVTSRKILSFSMTCQPGKHEAVALFNAAVPHFRPRLPEVNLDLTHLLALAAAVGWASGLRLYLTVLLVGIAGHWGWVTLPPGLAVLGSPLVMGCAAVLALVEFLADKIPFVDSAWDALHTLIRIPAGAALVAGLFSGWAGDAGQAWTVVAALAGGGLAAAAHTAKASTRAMANTSPEPFSNIGLSLAGDVAVPTMLWLAWAHPFIFFPLLVVSLAVMAALIWFCFKFLRALLKRVRRPASA